MDFKVRQISVTLNDVAFYTRDAKGIINVFSLEQIGKMVCDNQVTEISLTENDPLFTMFYEAFINQSTISVEFKVKDSNGKDTSKDRNP